MSEASASTGPRQIDRKKKLGKGLGALLGETRREEPLVRSDSGQNQSGAQSQSSAATAEPAANGLTSIPVANIEPLPGQPRTHFDEESLDSLASSIATRGVIQPIIVSPLGKGRYRLVAGERRWRAAQRARLHEIPALVRDLDQREVMALALIENLQREDLNPVEEARAYQKLSEDDGMTQAEIAKLVDKSRSHVANFQRLLALPDTVLALVADGALSMGHARALIGREEASELAQKAVSEGLSVRQMEALTRKPRTRQPSSLAGTTHGDAGDDADIAAVQGHLEEFLGMPVKITTDTTPNSGAVTIRFRTLDQLDLICQRLTGGDI
ncbi:Chromosome (plasmid) partitioning protein ParB / Stage 0 sporulation protein J [Qipengyuania citrea LAMA 915]|jgi:ParB family transcriptional regulator, chromosome partitioning protein|uniref:Chromosome (Plasmid) partitioning protein ParB / Stage 0 sporulation protein J n=1 Tax=Qipengyuania citrea LAMA 915 TaxID=1306953 RepID=A0A0L1K9W0_9SPHN|nr:ParB/RepB/Spo0J family partition protein [Qipengyuania citrea]KNH00711.1 Chromosome (plasmid) partitioning protein ParB / Stage 0 sporulation protein J [Qipengyuania citrea LAMA 915]